MILKRLFISDTGEALFLHRHCSGLRETEHQAILLGDRAVSQNDSFSGKMVLKWPFMTTGKTQLICSGVLGGRTDLVDILGLLRKWSCKELQRSLFTFIQVLQETGLIKLIL